MIGRRIAKDQGSFEIFGCKPRPVIVVQGLGLLGVGVHPSSWQQFRIDEGCGEDLLGEETEVFEKGGL